MPGLISMWTGDWQLDQSPAFDQIDPSTHKSVRFAENVEIIELAIREAREKHGATLFGHLGDLTEHKDPRALELDAAAHLFAGAIREGGRWVAIAGNHDGGHFHVTGSSFAALETMGRAFGTAFKAYHEVDFDPELGMLAIPYIHRATPEEIRALIIAAYDKFPFVNEKTFAAIHYGLHGAKMGARNIVLPSDYLGADVLLAGQFGGAIDRVFAGHIHKGQEIQVEAARGYHPGSPVICDMGERTDPKNYLIFNHETREVTVVPIQQRRRWISLSLPPVGDPERGRNPEFLTAQWGPDDLVAINGTHDKGENPVAALEAAFAAGAPRPFSLKTSFTVEREARAARADLSEGEGLHEKLQQYARDYFPNRSKSPGIVAPATEQALAEIRTQGGAVYCTVIWPESIKIRGLLTFESFDYNFTPGMPLLVDAPNGTGKTNLMGCVNIALTGAASKKLKTMASYVRQVENAGRVELMLAGTAPDGQVRKYRITRTFKVDKSGGCSQDIKLESLKPDGTWDNSLSDGGNTVVQATIDQLIGGGHDTHRTISFTYQRDPAQFILTPPAGRKGIIGEIIGLQPLMKAYTVLDKKAKDSEKAVEKKRSELGGMEAIAEDLDARLEGLNTDVAGANAEAENTLLAVTPAEAAEEARRGENTTALETVATAEQNLNKQPDTAIAMGRAEEARNGLTTSYDRSHTDKESQQKVLQGEVDGLLIEAGKISALPEGEVKVLEDLALGARSMREHAAGKQSTAQSGFNSNEHAVKTAERAFTDANTALEQAKSNPVLAQEEPNIPALEQAAQAARTSLESAQADQKRISDPIPAKQTEMDTEAEKGRAAKAARAALEGVKEGPCEKCLQTVTGAHLEGEKARLDKEIEEISATWRALKAEHTKMTEDQTQAITATATAREAERAAADKVAAARITMERITAARGRVTAAEETLEKARTTLDTERAKTEELRLALDAATQELDQRTSDREKAENEAIGAREAFNSAARIRATLDAKQGELGRLVLSMTSDKLAYDTAVEEADKKLKTAREAHETQKAITEGMRQKLTEARAAQIAAQDALTTAQIAAAGARSRRDAARTKADGIHGEIAKLTAQKKQQEDAKFELATLEQRAAINLMAAALLDPRSGLPVHLIDQALPTLEDRMNYYLGRLSPGLETVPTVRLDTLDGDKETLAIFVENGMPGRALEAASFSGGELDRIEYAAKFALGEMAFTSRGVRFGAQFLDEPQGGLERLGKMALGELIMERAELYPVTIATSHDPEFKALFPSHLTFRKDAEGRTVPV